MFESVVGFSVSFTRQCCGIGSGGGGGAPPALAPRPRPAPAGAAAGGAPAGGGGGVKMPAGTTSADITVVCGVESVFRLSQFVEVPAARNRAAISIGVLVLSTFDFRLYFHFSLPAFRFQFVATGAAVCGAFCGRDAT